MRLSTTLALLLTLALVALSAAPAFADDDRPGARRPPPGGNQKVHKKHVKEVLKGLQAGIKSLRAIGGQERAIAHLEALMVEVKREARQKGRVKKAGDRKSDAGKAEKQKLGQMLELLLYAHEVLRKADRDDQAKIMKHGAHALKMLWSGRHDEEAMGILSTAPSKEDQVRALYLAAEILSDRDDDRHARMLFGLAREFEGEARRGKPEPRDAKRWKHAQKRGEHADGEEEDDEERRGLRRRIEILRMAMPALREAERKDAAEMLERAIHTGELLLDGREDAEAQRIYRNTPSLGQLAELLHLASRLWREFKHPEQAEAVMELSRHYAQRSREQNREREVAERREHEGREHEGREHEGREHEGREHEGRDDLDRRIQHLRRELHELQQVLQRLMRELGEIARDK